MLKMRLGILSSLWNRRQLTELFLDRLAHLKKKYDIIPACVGSENQFAEDCKERGILYVDFPNKPLGLKWNEGIRQFERQPVTHIMILGSDDFVSDKFIEFSMRFAEDKDFTGCKDLFMYGAHPRRRGFGQLFYFRYQGFLVGPGRCYSKEIVKEMNWTPWNVNKNAGLDGSITKSVKRLGGHVRRGSFVAKDRQLFVVDIKTSGNISGIPGGAKPYDGNFHNMLMENLPHRETENLITFLKSIKPL